MQDMIEKYIENPSYGPTKKLEGELKIATQKMRSLETGLSGLRSYHETLIDYSSNSSLGLVPALYLTLYNWAISGAPVSTVT